jgi:uncharacterized membrane protein YbhN (UPF0104 family)
VTEARPQSGWRRSLPWLGALIGIAALAWLLRGFELDKFRAVIAGADVRFLVMLPVAVAAEQWARAWKWRQLLYPMHAIGTPRLFGAIMAGYLAGLLIPFGFSTLARAWLVARCERLPVSAVLATVVLDRLTDGIVFALLVPVALLLVAFPDPTGGIRAGLTWAAAGSFVLFTVLLVALALYRQRGLRPDGWLARLIERLPARIVAPVQGVVASFAQGIVWPRELWRGIGIVMASVVIKLIAATHFLWAGLALGVTLQPAHYLFLMVCLGFVVILGHFVRIAGTFVVAAIFVLGLFGVREETSLAMVLAVQAASVLTVAAVGSLALWRQGVALAELRSGGVEHAAARSR